MTTELRIEWFGGLLLIIIGLSHVVQPKLWVRLFIDLFALPYAGLIVGVFTVPFGLLIVAGHNTWVLGVPLIVTIIGWGWTVKGTLYLLCPSLPARVAARHLRHPNRFALAGAIMAVAGGAVIAQLCLSKGDGSL